mmetsp:Transcript_29517/g.91259  ORF Transcript_29517/g.91259 Transcript_29517/m.91259 type:complete len:273 (+) Transcript_29517:1071-1889(+)
MAQRGLRDVDGDGRLRRVVPRVVHVGAVHHRHAGPRVAVRRVTLVAPHPGADPQSRRGGAGLRRHLLLQGRVRRPHGPRRRRRGGVRQGPPRVHEGVRVRQRDDGGPLGRVGAGVGQTRHGDDGRLDEADGLSRTGARGRPRRRDAGPEAVPLLRRRRQGRGRRRAHLARAALRGGARRAGDELRRHEGQRPRGAVPRGRGRGREGVGQAQRGPARAAPLQVPRRDAARACSGDPRQDAARRGPHRLVVGRGGALQGGPAGVRALPGAAGRV